MTYSYIVTKDIISKQVDTDSLIVDIVGSTITIALDSVIVDGDTLNITFKAGISADEKAVLDIIVSNHPGIATEKPDEVNISNSVRTHNVAEDDFLRVRHTGLANFAIPANTKNSSDWLIPQLTFNGQNVYSYMTGVKYKVIGGNAGDKLDFSIVDVDNILGYGAGLVLDSFASDFYVFPDETAVIKEHRASLVAGLYVRCTYNNTGAAPATFICNALRYIDTEL